VKTPTILPSQSYIWGVVALRFEQALLAKKLEIWELSGLFTMFGPLGESFTGETEGNENIERLAGHLVRGLAYQLQAHLVAGETVNGLGVGRPRNLMIRYLGPELVQFFQAYHVSGGRHSVATSVDGRLAQVEDGPLFKFVTEVLIPLNQFLIEEMHWKPLSPARVARFGLYTRRYKLWEGM
jgi:hypothetical protein